ncbi:zinc ABC transporter substrate-binding protein [Rhizobium helianthi]|uniref:High-affinity zinc uptake system protein ZnuA n=1 Tax=Rhizobium helianthi TaxID=1132695 RepID=A0ABW4LYN1_9HYPH
MKILPASLFAFTMLSCATPVLAAPEVVVSIKPIHSLVAGVMQGVGEPKLIVQGAASPHTYSMKPSNAQTLEKADIVFWVGINLETFLDKPLDALGKKAKVVSLADSPNVSLLPLRQGGTFETHQHEAEDGDAHDHAGAHGHAEAHKDAGAHKHNHAHQHAEADGHKHGDHGHDHDAHNHDDHGDHDDHNHSRFDMHMWLDPHNAKAMVKEIEATLSASDSANAAAYKKNAEALIARIDQMDTDIATKLAPVKDKPSVVFHDAYQYFERHYGLNVVGSITVSPETAPGAARLSEIQAKLKTLNAGCVFAEPQFQPKLIEVVTAGTKAKSGTLDPEGATLKEGPDLYFQLMQGLSSSMADCLTKAS